MEVNSPSADWLSYLRTQLTVKNRLFTIYMEKPVGRWFVQMESKIPILEISVWGGVYHLNNRPNLPKEPRATLTSSKWRLKQRDYYSTGSPSSKYVVYATACVYRELYGEITDRKKKMCK